MTNLRRIHIFGASGSGTTTLAGALSARINCRHLDVDNYFWHLSDPPFQQKRERSERIKMLLDDLTIHSSWILSGSICGWDEEIVPLFDLAVFLWIPSDLRMARLETREMKRYGEEVVRPDGVWVADSAAFLAWAARYDDAGPDLRSRQLHETWMETLNCPVLRLEGDMAVEERLSRVMKAIGGYR